ncbi:hypothetical protein [Bacillus pseudomycoides]|uniref:hypothetical protein n=1 Tax=Bacillus pseudomycoides TaxID=64104 RepID=UPI003F741269
MDSLIKRPLKIKHLKDGSGIVPEPFFGVSIDNDHNYNLAYNPRLPVEEIGTFDNTDSLIHLSYDQKGFHWSVI